MENCKLPIDLLINILARLSVRSLMRFKCVCKFFYDLIKHDYQFKERHYEFSRTKNHCVLLEFDSADFSNQLFYLVYKELESSETRCIYVAMPNSETRYIKCCDGMLCLIVCKGDTSVGDINNMDIIVDVFVLNPFTREIKVLPSIKVPNKPPNKPPIRVNLHIGFGFGLSNNMVGKVIMLLNFEDANWECEDNHEIVMVCSQIDDSWNWRQIDDVPHGPKHFLPPTNTNDFYLKGKYYWQCPNRDLIWFDMDDEVFGKIKIPSELKTNFVTTMNETIVVISKLHLDEGDEGYIDIWLMNENNNIINWNKQARIRYSNSIYEYWLPVGIWNPSGDLLVFSSHMEFIFEFRPDLIFIDLVTRENKIICTNQVKKSAINVGLDSAGNAQICSERNITKDEEWSDDNVAWLYFGPKPYARDFHESLKFL